MVTFKEIIQDEQLLAAVDELGFTEATEIQVATIPPGLEGRDLIGQAKTGSGKTFAFGIPILHHISHERDVQALILAPTRELCQQIAHELRKIAKHKHVRVADVYGGVAINPQIDAIEESQIVVGTPGRILDHLERDTLRTGHIRTLVLDEADRMFDMGFIDDIHRIIQAIPEDRQTLLFSATMPGEIASLAQGILHHPERVEVTPQATAVERIEQQVLFVDKDKKEQLLLDLLSQRHLERVLVFTRTKHAANKVSIRLARAGVKADAIHGNKSQNARTQALTNFKNGRTRVLVATDIAARGIDIDGISHVINYELPNDAESYVHRIGRTARAGADGTAYSFCAADERDLLRAIERLTRVHIPVMAHPYHSPGAQHATGDAARQPPRQQYGRPGPGRAPRNTERSGERSSEHKPRYGTGGAKRGRVRTGSFRSRR